MCRPHSMAFFSRSVATSCLRISSLSAKGRGKVLGERNRGTLGISWRNFQERPKVRVLMHQASDVNSVQAGTNSARRPATGWPDCCMLGMRRPGHDDGITDAY
jgi:hypothetical protein